jgi:hypothetical protein
MSATALPQVWKTVLGMLSATPFPVFLAATPMIWRQSLPSIPWRGPLNVCYRETQNVPILVVFTITYRCIIVINLHVPAVVTLHINRFKQALTSDPWSSIMYFTGVSHLHFTLLDLLPLLSFFCTSVWQFHQFSRIFYFEFCILSSVHYNSISTILTSKYIQLSFDSEWYI